MRTTDKIQDAKCLGKTVKGPGRRVHTKATQLYVG
jgi:hypothetical protein